MPAEFSDDGNGGSTNAARLPSQADEPPRLPDSGRIIYRVDWGEREFEVGRAVSEWTIHEGRYHLRMESETVGLAFLVKPYRLVMESRGRATDWGLFPDAFAIRRNDEHAGENVLFDWQTMTAHFSESGEKIPIEYGAQDMLSLNFQIGFMRHPTIGSRLPLVTGKKYGVYLLEKLPDEDIETPIGRLSTLHLRADHGGKTELWLSYKHALLPVKLLFTEKKGDTFVQTVSAIRFPETQNAPEPHLTKKTE